MTSFNSLDVYSFALILWELATLSIPFSEFSSHPEYTVSSTDSSGQQVHTLKTLKLKVVIRSGFFLLITLQKAIEEGLRPSLFCDPSVPNSFNDLISRCWKVQPSDRGDFSSALADLEKISPK